MEEPAENLNNDTIPDGKIPDFVLVYSTSESVENKKKRELYEKKLVEDGLILKRDCPKIDIEENQIYVYAPHDLLLEFAERLKLRMPVSKERISEVVHLRSYQRPTNIITSVKSMVGRVFRLNRLNEDLFQRQRSTLMAEFSRHLKYLFDCDSEEFFTQSERSMIVSYILELQTYEDECSEYAGIKELISDEVYVAAYPLHDENTKNLLLNEWGNPKKWYKNQPIDALKDYFGVKIALYFAWLGFYTDMLIPVAIFGVLIFFYGCITVSRDTFAAQICDPRNNITMCPQCDKYCDYWDLTQACLYSKITHTFDNHLTMVFAIVMSVWSAIYLNTWRSTSAEIVHRWGLAELRPEAFFPRPEYIARLKKLRKKNLLKMEEKICEVTGKDELDVTWKIKVPVFTFTYSCALFWICILLAILIGILVFRLSAITSEEIFATDSRNFIVPISSAILDLICILILNKIYDYVALWLTKQEFLRTQSEFDDSLTLKIYIFQFINYYSGFIYIAFVKGRIIGRPDNYLRVFGRRLEECSPGGCLMELCIQLAIVMIGAQIIGQLTEYGIPYLTQKWNEWQINKRQVVDPTEVVIGQNQNSEGTKLLEKNKRISTNKQTNVYENKDHKLIGWDDRGLFDEYLDMVIQYGFVTLFVTAFPLAPLCALMNNILELRFDARKFLRDYRRPVAQNVKDIGIWLKIMDFIGHLSILSNGCIIAFSSNFIPRLIYMLNTEGIEDDSGFLDWSLTSFSTSDFEAGYGPLNPKYNATVCRYADYRNPHYHVHKYDRSKRYWHILAARFIFVLIYQNVVLFLKLFVKWFYPEKPKALKTQIMRDHWRLCKIITKHQLEEKKNASARSSHER